MIETCREGKDKKKETRREKGKKEGKERNTGARGRGVRNKGRVKESIKKEEDTRGERISS